MKKYLVISAAVATLMSTAAPSFAQDATSNMYVVRSGEDMNVMTEGSTEGSRVLMGENFAPPADCPEGSYYMSGENMITACGEAGAAFEFAAPSEGQTLPTDFPEGAMVMTPRESGEQKSSGATGGSNSPDRQSDDSGGASEGGGDVGNSGGGGGDGQNDDSGGDSEGGGDVGGSN